MAQAPEKEDIGLPSGPSKTIEIRLGRSVSSDSWLK